MNLLEQKLAQAKATGEYEKIQQRMADIAAEQSAGCAPTPVSRMNKRLYRQQYRRWRNEV
jgi:hypothetical protein